MFRLSQYAHIFNLSQSNHTGIEINHLQQKEAFEYPSQSNHTGIEIQFWISDYTPFEALNRTIQELKFLRIVFLLRIIQLSIETYSNGNRNHTFIRLS